MAVAFEMEPQPTNPIARSMSRQAPKSVPKDFLLRRMPKRDSVKSGEHSANASKGFLPSPPPVGEVRSARFVVLVLTVRTLVAEVVPEAMVSNEGAKEQETCAGSVPQVRATVPA